MRYVYLATFLAAILVVSVLGFRGSLSTRPPLELIPDMVHQAKYKPQTGSPFFADGRADRQIPAGAIAYGRDSNAPQAGFLRADDALYRGKNADGSWLAGFPKALTLDARFMARGQDRYTIYCTPCHGALGDGNGITKKYGMGATPSYDTDAIRQMADGQIFDVISNGHGNMLSYADKLSPEDRWAVVAYVRALQRAQRGSTQDVPANHKAELGLN